MSWENAYAARIDENDIVQQVIVIPFCNDDDGKVTAYCNGIGLEGTWLDCSWLGARRGAFPGKGWSYDSAGDRFVAPVVEAIEEA